MLRFVFLIQRFFPSARLDMVAYKNGDAHVKGAAQTQFLIEQGSMIYNCIVDEPSYASQYPILPP